MKMSHKSHDKPKKIVETYLNLNSIWDFCEINESPMDGHCFISSVEAQLNEEQDIRIYHLLQLIISNVFANCKRYSLNFDDNDESLLFEGLHQYVYNKHFDSDFIDLVPIIIGEELDIDFIIIEDSSVTHIKPDEHRPDNTPVILHKIRKHYNGIIPNPMQDKWLSGRAPQDKSYHDYKKAAMLTMMIMMMITTTIMAMVTMMMMVVVVMMMMMMMMMKMMKMTTMGMITVIKISMIIHHKTSYITYRNTGSLILEIW